MAAMDDATLAGEVAKKLPSLWTVYLVINSAS